MSATTDDRATAAARASQVRVRIISGYPTTIRHEVVNDPADGCHHEHMTGERNVLGGELEPCGIDPVTGFFRDGHCATGPEDLGSHTVCTVVTAEFLRFQAETGNDLTTPRPEYAFPGLRPGDRWCVVAARWRLAYDAGLAAPVVLAATHERSLDVVPLDALREFAVDVPSDPSSLL